MGAGEITGGLVSVYAALPMAFITAVIAALCWSIGSMAHEPAIAIDAVGLLATLTTLAYFLFGTKFVAANIKRIGEQDRRVDNFRDQHREQGRVVFSAVSRLGEVRWPAGTSRSMEVDRIQRRARTVEHALVHSHGGGVGSLEGHQAGGMPRLDTGAFVSLVAELEAAVDLASAQPADAAALARVDSALARIERELAIAELL